jgi:hypothetical protein
MTERLWGTSGFMLLAFSMARRLIRCRGTPRRYPPEKGNPRQQGTHEGCPYKESARTTENA